MAGTQRPKARCILSNNQSPDVCHWQHRSLSQQETWKYILLLYPTIQLIVGFYICHLVSKYLWNPSSLFYIPEHAVLCPRPTRSIFPSFSTLSKREFPRLMPWTALPGLPCCLPLWWWQGCPIGGGSRRVEHWSGAEFTFYLLACFFSCSLL